MNKYQNSAKPSCDKSTMIYLKSLEELNKTLPDLRNNASLMEDVILILSGDFC